MEFVNSHQISNTKLQKIIESPYNYLLTKKRSFLRKGDTKFVAESFKNLNSLFTKVSSISNNGKIQNSNLKFNVNSNPKLSLIHFRKKSIQQNYNEIKTVEDRADNSKSSTQKTNILRFSKTRDIFLSSKKIILKNLNHHKFFSSIKTKTIIPQIDMSNQKNYQIKQRGKSSRIEEKLKEKKIINQLVRKNETTLNSNNKEIKKNLLSEIPDYLEKDKIESPLDISSSAISITGMTENKPKINNQDSFISLEDAFNIKNLFLYGVFDGHGENGHLASKFVKENLIKNIENFLLNNDLTYFYNFFQSKNNMTDVLHKSFIKTQEEIEKVCFDVAFSGTTANIVMIYKNKLICANVGDSRSVLFSKSKRKNKQKWEFVDLSLDHKLNIESEKERIIKFNGKVERLRDKEGTLLGPLRVWFKNENYPGLSMSRSIGDLASREIGIISVPEIKFFSLNHEAKMIIIGSDGLWEYMNNQNIVDNAETFVDALLTEDICTVLAQEAKRQWTKNDLNVDDITIITVLFK